MDAADRWVVRLQRRLQQAEPEAFLDLIAEHLPGQPGNATRKNYLSSIRVYLRWAAEEGRSVLNAAPDDAQAYLRHLLLKHAHAPASIHNHLTRVRTLYDLLAERQAYSGTNPFTALKLPSNRPEEHRDLYTAAELQRLLAQADRAERALVLLGAHAGLTGPETVALRWEDIQARSSRLRVQGREVEASDELHSALRAYGAERGHTDLFAAQGQAFDYRTDHQLRSVIYQLCQRANVPYKAWRALRNAAGLRLLQLTGDPNEVAARLGLTTLKAVEPWLKMQTAQEPEVAEVKASAG